MPAQLCLSVEEPSQVGEVRRNATKLAAAAGLSGNRCSDAGIVATELATNLHRHATKGRVWMQTISTTLGTLLEITAIDSGPGVSDFHRCMQDGYSTGGTSGTGLGAVRRLSDEFDAFSTVGHGTVVVSRLHASAEIKRQQYVIGAVSLPAPYEVVCGDTWRVTDRDNSISVLVADGLGHGPLASEAAELAAGAFDAGPFVAPADYYARAHSAMSGSRGAAVARAVIDPNGRIEYSGIGNIAGSLVGVDGSRGLPSQNGTVGVEMRRQVAVQQRDWPPRGILLMHSDGITGRWTLDPYPGLVIRHPAVIAAIIARDFLRGRDDATVVVVSRNTRGQAA